MSRERSARCLPEARYDVDNSIRNPGFLNEFTQFQGGERRLFCWFENDGATRRQSWSQFPGRHQEREVPGNDIPFDLGCPARHIPEQIDGEGNIGDTGNRQGFAVIQRFELRELLAVLLNEIGQPGNAATSLRGTHLAPGALIEGFACGSHGPMDIFGPSLGHMSHHLTRSGIVNLEGFARGGIYPLAINQHLTSFTDKLLNFRCDLHLCVRNRHVSFLSTFLYFNREKREEHLPMKSLATTVPVIVSARAMKRLRGNWQKTILNE